MHPHPAIAKLIEGIPDPLPILSVQTDTFTTASQVNEVHSTLWPDDTEKIDLSIQTYSISMLIWKRLEDQQISAVRSAGHDAQNVYLQPDGAGQIAAATHCSARSLRSPRPQSGRHVD
jgi:hypothetical protein